VILYEDVLPLVLPRILQQRVAAASECLTQACDVQQLAKKDVGLLVLGFCVRHDLVTEFFHWWREADVELEISVSR
jgi:hypothetical protein